MVGVPSPSGYTPFAQNDRKNEGMKNAQVPVLPSVVMIVLLWLPFGFQMGPILEAWGVLGLYAEHGVFFFAGADSLMPQHQMRPIMTMLWGIGYAIDPNSWWAWHVELALVLLIKGVSMSSLALYLTGSRRWAVIAGLLFIVWPADTLQMAFRAMPITFAVAMTSASTALLVAAHAAPDFGRRCLLAACASLCLIAGTLTYELTLVFSPLPFLLIYAREGFAGGRAVVRRAWEVSVIWLLAAGVCVAYLAWTLMTAKMLYQTAVAPDRSHLISVFIDNLPTLFKVGVWRSLAMGWVDAARIAAHDFSTHLYFFAVGLVFCILLAVHQRQAVSSSGRVLIRTALIGMLCVLVGYLPYMVIQWNTSDRAFMFAALGSTMVFLALLVFVDMFSTKVASILAVVLLVLGTAQQLWQFREYASLSGRQREIMKAMVEQAPSLAPGQTMIILDGSQQLNDTYMLADLIPSVLTYLYGKPVRYPYVQVCFPQSGVWATRDAASQQGTCEETPDGWMFRWAAPVNLPSKPAPNPPDILIPKDKAVVVRIGPDGKGVGANRLVVDDSVVSQRYRHALAPDTWPLRFLEERPGESYRWDFGRRWTMQQVNHGAGWTYPGWIYSMWRPVSGIWTNKPSASLIFEMDPAAHPYQMSAHLLNAGEGARSTLKVKINDQYVAVKWNGPFDFTAEVPQGLLKVGSNMLELQTAPSTEFYALSIHFDWIALAPAQSSSIGKGADAM